MLDEFNEDVSMRLCQTCFEEEKKMDLQYGLENYKRIKVVYTKKGCDTCSFGIAMGLK